MTVVADRPAPAPGKAQTFRDLAEAAIELCCKAELVAVANTVPPKQLTSARALDIAVDSAPKLVPALARQGVGDIRPVLRTHGFDKVSDGPGPSRPELP